MYFSEFRHQPVVELVPSGGIDDHDVAPSLVRPLDTFHGDGRGIATVATEGRDLDLPSELLELVDGGRALQVGGHERRLPSFLAQQQRQLRSSRRLARALET